MQIPIYQIDAFAPQLFAGNPAAVCPLNEWLSDETMQAIAQENNLSETAFFIPENEDYAIRWFTPADEVDLCGHATLASAYVIFNYLQPERQKIKFSSRSGPLYVVRNENTIQLNFPALSVESETSQEVMALINKALRINPTAIYRGEDYLVILENEQQILNVSPNLELLNQLDLCGLIVSAKGQQVDFVSRFFVPKLAVPEDPVTGSAHCTLAPFWSKQLGKNKLFAKQLSARGGEIYCECHDDRVYLSGNAVPYLVGSIYI